MANSYRTPLLPFSPERQKDFWNKIKILSDDECWEWQGAKTSDWVNKAGKSYGTLDVRRKSVRAHRVAFALTYNKEPLGHVLHHCDNPACCNPSHLYEGSQADNIRDRDARNRGVFVAGEQHPSRKLTWKDVEYIRSLPDPPDYALLAKNLNVDKSTVIKVRHHQSWRSKPPLSPK